MCVSSHNDATGKSAIASDRSISNLEAMLANCEASRKVLEEKIRDLQAELNQAKNARDHFQREQEKEHRARKELQQRYDRLRFDLKL